MNTTTTDTVRFGSLEEVKAAVGAGGTVYWQQRGYQVEKDIGGYVVVCVANDRVSALTDDYEAGDFFAVAD